MTKINMFCPYVGITANDKVRDVLNSGWIGQGAIVTDFENEISKILSIPYVVATTTSSFAIRLALEIIGVMSDDEVITTPMTCTLTNHPIIEVGAKIVFADIQQDTGNIDPSDVKNKITPKTKAIICTHWGGYPSDLDELHNVAKQYNIPIIEDASEAFGATYKGKNIGTVSQFTALSFQAIQIITTAEGGALCVDNNDTSVLTRNMGWYGIDRVGRTPNVLGYYDFDITSVGFGYHMTNVSAAIGLENLKTFDWQKKHRKLVADKYTDLLSNVSGVTLIDRKTDRESSNHFFTIHVENRNDFCSSLKAHGISVSIVHDRNDRYTVFGGLNRDLVGLNTFSDSFICLPNHASLSIDDVEYVCETIKAGW